MPTTIASLTNDPTGQLILSATPFTANTDGFLRVHNESTSAQTIKADCYVGETLGYSYSGTFSANNYLYVPIDPTITAVNVSAAGATPSSVAVDLSNKNRMSTMTIAASGSVAGPDGTANVTCTGDPLSVSNQSTTTYYAFLGGSTSPILLPAGQTTSLGSTTQDYVQISTSSTPGSGITINIRHVDKSVVVIDDASGVQVGYPAIVSPSSNYVYLVNISASDASVWMQGYCQAAWSKIQLVVPKGGVYRGDMTQFDSPKNPPNPPPPNYQVSLGFSFNDDPTIAIKRPTRGT